MDKGITQVWLNAKLDELLRKQYSQPMTPEERLKGGASVLPIIGDAISGYDAFQSAKKGNYGEAVLNALGLLPLIPGLAGIIKNTDQAADILHLYHGSPTSSPIRVDDRGVFGGLFASADETAALSHGDYLHRIDMPAGKIADSQMLDVPDVRNRLEDRLGKLTDDEYDAVHNAVVRDEGLYGSGVNEDRIKDLFAASDLGEAGWQAQRIRGDIAKDLGYSAVKMSDEHGTSYLILPGAVTKR